MMRRKRFHKQGSTGTLTAARDRWIDSKTDCVHPTTARINATRVIGHIYGSTVIGAAAPRTDDQWTRMICSSWEAPEHVGGHVYAAARGK